MIKNLKRVIFLVLLQISCITYSADEWDKFNDLSAQYYYLDDQKFNKISCQINVPILKQMIDKMIEQFAPIQEKIEIKYDLSKFRMTFDRISGLKFIDPEFQIRFLTKKGMVDYTKAEKGINDVRNVMKKAVEAFKVIITDTLGNYLRLKKQQFQNLDVKIKDIGGKTIIEYQNGGVNFLETSYGNIVEIKETTSSGAEILTKQIFEKTLNDKYIIQYEEISLTKPLEFGSQKKISNSDTSIKYQNINNIIFPKEINSVANLILQSIPTKRLADINFINCHVN